MPTGGTLRIETDNVVLGAAERAEEPLPGEYVMVAVADTGSGIPDDILEKVFEPFFTTKPVGEGTGLGLSQVLGVAQQHGGGVRISTELEVGTTVRLYLPRALEPGARSSS
jgi:signal transduction histidine kinase